MQEKSDEDTFSELKYQMLSNIYSTWGLISHDTGSTVDLFHWEKKNPEQIFSSFPGPSLFTAGELQNNGPKPEL
jgi:hypothetical protein